MLETSIRDAVVGALRRAQTEGVLPDIGERLKVARPDRPEFGDWSVNAAMVAAKEAGRKPRELAADLLPYLSAIAGVDRVEIAGPGFLNLFLQPAYEAQVFADFVAWQRRGGDLEPTGGREKILVEFVSANPTGPLHVGHGRGAAVGDSVARLLRRVGHEVATEYYVNDAGKQIAMLGRSLELRVRQQLGEDVELPPDAYRGDYLIDVAKTFLETHGAAFQGWDEATRQRECQQYAEREILAGIAADLERFGVQIDHWRSERELYQSGAVDRALAHLRDAGALEDRDGALWFRSDLHGDEKPRVVVRDNGEPTYFAADIAYHEEKFERGFDRAIDFWGADHHGYEPRVRAAMNVLGVDARKLEVRFIQFVALLRGGETVSMSTRAGTFDTLAQVVDEVGVDAARFFYQLRRAESHLDFDLDLARTQANENPVYYVQYAHARVCSLRRQAAERGVAMAEAVDAAALVADDDRALLTVLLRYPEVLQQAAAERAPHLLVFYLQDLAAAFHGYYNRQRILDAEPAAAAAQRLLLADAVGHVVADGLVLIGVSAPERM